MRVHDFVFAGLGGNDKPASPSPLFHPLEGPLKGQQQRLSHIGPLFLSAPPSVTDGLAHALLTVFRRQIES